MFSRNIRFSIESSDIDEPRTPEGDFVLADKLIDAWLINRVTSYGHIGLDLRPDRDEYIMDELERTLLDYPLWEFEFAFDTNVEPFDGFYLCLQLGLALSAVVRGDIPELQSLLDRNSGVLLPRENPYECRDLLNIEECTFYKSSVVAAAAKFGTADIMRVLVANQHKFPCTQTLRFRGDLAADAVRYGNREVLEVLIEDLLTAREEHVTIFPSTPKKSISHRMRPIFLACFESVCFSLDIADDVMKQCEAHSEDPDLHFDILMQAIKSGSTEAVRFALKKASPLINHQPKTYNYQSPLFLALYFEWKMRFPCLHARLPLIKVLLENGADPMQIHPKTKKSILEHLAMRGDREFTAVLLEHEKKLGGMSSLLSCSPERQSYWLRIAIRWRCYPLIEFLLDNTEVNRFVTRRTEYLVEREDLHVAKIAPENKVTTLSIRGFSWDRSFIDVHEVNEGLLTCFYISPINSRTGSVIYRVCGCPWCNSVAQGTPGSMCMLNYCSKSRAKYVNSD